MKAGLNQTSAWALAIILSLFFFGLTISMMLRVADEIAHEETKVLAGHAGEGEVIRPETIESHAPTHSDPSPDHNSNPDQGHEHQSDSQEKAKEPKERPHSDEHSSNRSFQSGLSVKTESKKKSNGPM